MQKKPQQQSLNPEKSEQVLQKKNKQSKISSNSQKKSKSYQILPKIVQKKMPPQKLLSSVQKILQNKLHLSLSVKSTLLSQQTKQFLSQQKIENQLELINKKNQQYRKQLELFMQNLNQQKKQLLKNKQIQEEQKLLKQYQHILKQQQILKKVKKIKRKMDQEICTNIKSQQRNIHHNFNQNQKDFIRIAKYKTAQICSSNLKQQNLSQKEIPINIIPQIKIRKSKNVQELKDIGRQYLQFAKNAQKMKSQKVLLKLDNKNIDYQTEIKQLIKLKVQDLSKKPEIKMEQTILSKKKKILKTTLISTGSIQLNKSKSLSGFKEKSSKEENNYLIELPKIKKKSYVH